MFYQLFWIPLPQSSPSRSPVTLPEQLARDYSQPMGTAGGQGLQFGTGIDTDPEIAT